MREFAAALWTALLVSLAVPHGLLGQTDPVGGTGGAQAWILAGAGMTHFRGLSARLGVNVGSPRWQLAGRFGANQGAETDLQYFFNDRYVRDLYYEAGLLVGRSLSSAGQLTISAGLARVWGDADNASFAPRLGVPIEMVALHVFGGRQPAAGVGISLHANLNGQQSFYGVAVTAGVGAYGRAR